MPSLDIKTAVFSWSGEWFGVNDQNMEQQSI